MTSSPLLQLIKSLLENSAIFGYSHKVLALGPMAAMPIMDGATCWQPPWTLNKPPPSVPTLWPPGPPPHYTRLKDGPGDSKA